MQDEDHQKLFLDWLEEHSASIMKVARAYTPSDEERQDLAQEILLQSWRSVPRFAGDSSPATWFYRVALHTAMNWRRQERPRRERQRPILEVHTIAGGPDGAEVAQHRDTVERLYAAIHRLSEADAALVLLYLDSLSYREIADVLGITEGHVGVKLHRAKKALAAQMKGEADGDD